MRLETFRGSDVAAVSRQARAAFGDDAMIVRTSSRRMADGSTAVEIVVADANEVDRLRRRLTASPLPEFRARSATPPRSALGARLPWPGKDAGAPERAARPYRRPFVLALVGPTGAGKTTTLAKLAAHVEAFGARRVGALTIDTYRVGALEQLQLYADVAGFPVEVVYEAREAEPALRRLAGCDVVLVDTPGRGPRAAELNARWQELLRAVRPDETHLVLAAGTRADVAASAQADYEPLGVTHLLLTKLDEVPDDAGVAALAAWLDLPTRWVADGQDVPSDLKSGPARVLASLGIPVPPGPGEPGAGERRPGARARRSAPGAAR